MALLIFIYNIYISANISQTAKLFPYNIICIKGMKQNRFTI